MNNSRLAIAVNIYPAFHPMTAEVTPNWIREKKLLDRFLCYLLFSINKILPVIPTDINVKIPHDFLLELLSRTFCLSGNPDASLPNSVTTTPHQLFTSEG